jgi:hypothetical protein
LLTLASAGGALYFGRNLKRGAQSAPARRSAAGVVARFTPKQVGLAVVLLGLASLFGIVLGSGPVR